MTKREVLTATTFGKRIAEDEGDALASYFVETDQWRKVFSGEVDVVYGPKGSGKSAMYALLRLKRGELYARGIIPAAAESVRGTPAFEGLITDPPASEEQFRGLWKVYFLALIGAAFRILKLEEAEKDFMPVLEDGGLIHAEFSLRRMLKSALDLVRRIDSVGTEIKVNPNTGMPEGVGAKLTLREPGSEESKLGFVSADTLLEKADRILSGAEKKLWIIIDRLDVAFAESPQLEGNALRALFRVYRDMAALSNVSLKIFIRDDIWARITAGGFREASHITRSINITWDAPSLLNLVVRRALHNDAVRSFYAVDPAKVLASAEEQSRLFYRLFPAQVDPGARKSSTLDWMLTRTADSTGQTAPRELIHLLSAARDSQIKLLELGTAEPPDEALIDRTALKNALPEVSKVRFQQTLCAEHPALKGVLEKLEGEKTQQSASTLAKIWKVSEPEALATAEKLVEIGFFEKRGTKEQPVFWVPFLYRDALKLVQGPAD